MKWIIALLFPSISHASDLSADFYTRKVRPLFDARCLSCHSCMNAPCQMNLQSYEGFLRGANKLNVYNGSRIDATIPTRLWVDAHATQEWRDKGFFTVNTSKDPAQNLFMQMITMKSGEKEFPTKLVNESRHCAATANEKKIAMPYALPGLSTDEMATLQNWIAAGAPGPNGKDLRQQLVSRYDSHGGRRDI